MLEIKLASLDDAVIIHQLAHKIYYPTYTGILSQAQMDFMLDKSYTIEAVKDSMLKEQQFYMAIQDDQPIGFMALKVKDENILRIEKLYLLPAIQGKGIGRRLIQYAKDTALKLDKQIVELNVNRGNKAYYFYKRLGFKVVEEVDIPYYEYILDDYVMQVEAIKKA